MITWTLPIKLSSEANSREYWAISYARHKKQKIRISQEFLIQKLNLTLPIKIILTRVSPRPYDSDNLQSAFKYIRDSIAEHLIPGTRPGMADSHPGLIWEYRQEKGKPKEYYIIVSFETLSSCFQADYKANA